MNTKGLAKSALVYEITGRRDQALSALELAVQNGYSLQEIRRDLELASLRQDPRYARLDKAGSKSSR